MKDFKPEEIFNEFIKMQQLKFFVDHAAYTLMTKELTKEDIDILLKNTKRSVLQLFPDKKDTYNLIYKSRFKRLIEDFQDFEK